MHGNDAEDRNRKRHMWPISTRVATIANSSPSDEAYFCKDGRKISVGDCALFQAEGSPPFIGIIRRLSTKEEHPKLGVNWLYRPADVKLGKGILFDATPNEVFYSFHKDEISAAFLLHPCKVAFLRKGADLPPGISSFVCRRVYDTANKCLWWLTDKDYINEWQEEVNQLLNRTQLEMYAEGRSPKPSNSPASSQQLKVGCDSGPNTAASFSSQQVKGKKRERGDQGSEPLKGDRASKTDDGEVGHGRLESMIPLEIAKITDREGSLLNLDCVEKLVQLMQSNRHERKLDLSVRVMLADVIAATERIDCLGKFMQLRGLSILDDWLQEAHKGKVGDNSSPKEGDKSVEDLLLALLRALDKLPVNLHALQSCNIGKSVNHLRSHKNLEIHKKARSLVDTWKKRVDAEMKSNDAKSGSSQSASWPGKSSFSEVSHSGNKRSGSSDGVRGTVSHPVPTKNAPSKLAHGDSGGKLGSLSPSFAKLSIPAITAATKDSYSKIGVTNGTSDVVLPVIKEEKSSSSSQSQNNGQSCSSDHPKIASTGWKDDARSSTAVSITRTSGSSSRHKKSINGYLGSGGSGIQKESFVGDKLGSTSRNVTSDRILQVGVTSDSDNVNSQRLIVKIPNPARSPAQSVNGGSLEDIAIINCQASSPVMSNIHDHADRKLKGKGEACSSSIVPVVNNEPWQGNNAIRNGASEMDEVDRSLMVALDEEQNRNDDDVGKSSDVPKTTYLSAGNDTQVLTPDVKCTKFYDASFNPMNALIESCVGYSETTPSLSGADELGMNLLASVAADEISKSGMISPCVSPARTPLQEYSNSEKDSKSRFSCDNLSNLEQGQQADLTHDSHKKQELDVGSVDKDGHAVMHDMSQSVTDGKPNNDKNDSPLASGVPDQPRVLSVKAEIKPSDESHSAESNGMPCHEPSSKPTQLPVIEEATQCLHKRRRPNIKEDMGGFIHTIKKPKSSPSFENTDVDPMHEKIVRTGMSIPEMHQHPRCDGSKVFDDTSNHVDHKGVTEKSFSSLSVETNVKRPGNVEGSVDEVVNGEEKSLVALRSVVSQGNVTDTGSLPCSVPAVCPDDMDIVKSECAKSLERDSAKELNSENVDQACVQLDKICDEKQAMACGSSMVKQDANVENKMEENAMSDQQPNDSTSGDKFSWAEVQKSEEVGVKSVEDIFVEAVSVAERSGVQRVAPTDTVLKVKFDLNEGLPTDDGNQDEPASTFPVDSNAVLQPSASPLSVSTMTNSITASITVAAAAKGPFFPSENMMFNKGDTRWKGSAAKSAFRRAERRKAQDPPSSTDDVACTEVSSSKQGRPPFDIDLNVSDERVVEDAVSQSSSIQQSESKPDVRATAGDILRSTLGSSYVALDLDLNRAEGPEMVGTSQKLEIPLLLTRTPSNGEQAPRNFDLNNGPSFDEVGAEPAIHYAQIRSNGPCVPSLANSRTTTDMGNLSSWFPAGISHSQVSLPPLGSDRMEQPYPVVATPGSVQRILGSSSGGPLAYSADMYRTPVLSSSPAISFPSTNPFPYGSLPFGGGFPLASTSFAAGSTYMDTSFGTGPFFPSVPSHIVGSAARVSAPFARPYWISHLDAPAMDGTRKWPRQGLDLNAGPISIDADPRDERFNAVRQLSIANPQALTEEQMKMFQVVGGAGLKRQEPEGGFGGYK